MSGNLDGQSEVEILELHMGGYLVGYDSENGT